jgi:hypothetical protein
VHYWELRKEAQEFWEHGITNELVYLPDALPVLSESRRIPAEIYLKGDAWIELQFTLVGERNTQFVAIVESLYSQVKGNVDDDTTKGGLYANDVSLRDFRELKKTLTTIRGDTPMLVEVTHSVNTPDRMRLVSVPSVVWLKRPDLISSRFGDSLSLLSKTPSAVAVVDLHDRELGVTGIKNFPDSICQTPDDLIKAGSQVVKEITHGEADIIRDIMQFAFHHMPLLFNIIIRGDGICLVSGKCFQQLVQSVQMFLRPTKLQVGVDQTSA